MYFKISSCLYPCITCNMIRVILIGHGKLLLVFCVICFCISLIVLKVSVLYLHVLIIILNEI